MVRAAAKNHGNEAGGVGIVTDPADYAAIVAELKANGGALSYKTRFDLAKKAFTHTARYDAAISNYLTSLDADNKRGAFPSAATGLRQGQDLRYGENPHQHAAFYREPAPAAGTIANYTQLQGKELSYNNIADADAAWECVKAFDVPAACVIVKHANPCGVAVGAERWRPTSKAFSTDPTSAFGGIIAFNCAVDARRPKPSAASSSRCSSPRPTREAPRAVSRQAERARADRAARSAGAENASTTSASAAACWCRAPTRRASRDAVRQLKVVTKRAPTPSGDADLLFAWRVAKYVKSNAIVYCKDGMTIGVGAGQMSRVDSARIAAIKAENAASRWPARWSPPMPSSRSATASTCWRRPAPPR
jgi:phosphoribosylaminoimidazolecarboxamide formyltransferase/IMP cyclohydrolase